MIERIDAVDAATICASWPPSCSRPSGCRWPGSGPDEARSATRDRAASAPTRDARRPDDDPRRRGRAPPGRMGQTVCAAVEGAEDMELVGRADPLLGVTLAQVLADAEVVVDFTTPDTALGNALACCGRRARR